MADFKDYQDLAETGANVGKKRVDPKDEKFKSLYIAGIVREDETTGVNTTPGLLQIRGLTNNLNEVYMIITHVKNILVNEKLDKYNKPSLVCFSYQAGPRPWYGTSGKMCGQNRNERMADDFCKSCRSQIIVAGIYCDEDGTPIKNEDNKPELIFIRGKGMKFKNVSDYIQELSQLELDQFFDDDSDEARKFEKMVVNHKRFVTKVGVTTTDSNYGKKYVYSLEKGKELDKSTTEKILSISKKTLEDFNEKFDWSKTMNTGIDYMGQTQSQKVSKEQTFEDPAKESNNKKADETPSEDKGKQKNTVSFDDIDF